MTPIDDETIEVRTSELVDADSLRAWISIHLPELMTAGAQMRIRQFPSGFSNLTYRITLNTEDGARAVVLRRPPRGVKPGVAHDMAREHDILAALTPLGVPVPRPLARCDDATVIGAPFYLMEYVEGVILRGVNPEAIPEEDRKQTLFVLSHTFVNTLAQLHTVDVTQPPLASLGRPDGYVQRQVEGWARRWQASQTGAVPAMDAVATWLNAHRPPDRYVGLVHNDFKFDNLVLDPKLRRVVAILDWEMATIGDPLMDLGTSLAYWVEADDAPIFRALGLGVTVLPGSLRRAEVAKVYADVSGYDVSDIAFYYAFGLFKVAVIAQQIYARHVQGLTSDPRFAALGPIVAAMGESALRVTETGAI